MKQWVREIWHLYLQYMAGATATIPSGIAWGLWCLHHKEDVRVLVACLVVGLACFGFAYRWVGKKFECCSG